MAKPTLHATGHSGDDRTLCGDAFDLGADGEHPDPVLAAGRVITCRECRRIIDHCAAIKNYRETPTTPETP